MTQPGKLATQLRAVLKKDPAADRIALFWPQVPAGLPGEYQSEGVRFRVVYCPSELALREQLVGHHPNGSRLVLLTPLDAAGLAWDVLARLWRNNPVRVSPWRTLQDLLGVREIDPRLSRHAWLAEALLGCYDRFQDRIGAGEVLDAEQAWGALALALLGFEAPQNDIRSLLHWSLGSGVQERFDALPEPVRQHLGDWLDLGASQYSALLLALFQEGHGDELVAVGLAAQVLYHPKVTDHPEVFLARGRFAERFFGGRKLTPETLQSFGEEAAALVERLSADGAGSATVPQITAAEHTLADLDTLDLAIVSDLLPAGFRQRLERLAQTMQHALKSRHDGQLRQGLAEVRRHRQALTQPERVERAAMAVRLVQWLAEDHPLEAGDIARTVSWFAAEGGFVDWALGRIWAGDENEALDRAYQSVSGRVSKRREAANESFGRHLTLVARGEALNPALLPVEGFLERVLAPLAKNKRVLLVVMDGMSLAVFEELTDDLLRKHWIEYREAMVEGPRSLLAVLPTITRLSRTSLLAGALVSGGAADEKRLFSQHTGLKGISSSRFPPQLFHKADLSQPGGGGLAGAVRELVAGHEHRVLAVVINAVDDWLDGSNQVTVNWNLEQLSLLRQLLEAARESGRALIMTSDHGHVIDHGMQYRASDESGERFREQGPPPSAGECEVAGPRVLTSGGRAVLPWSGKIRYGGNKLGYHGGGSLQEVVIPLGVFLAAADPEIPAGWREVAQEHPHWWQLTPDSMGVCQASPPLFRTGPTPKKPKPDPRLRDLFDPPAGGASSPDWVDKLLGSPLFAQQQARCGRVPISPEQLATLLRTLVRHGGQLASAQLAQELKLPRVRLGGFLAGVKRLLNLDGYPVLSEDRDGGRVQLNQELLQTQFEL